MEEVKSTIVLEAVNSALGDSWAEFTFASNIQKKVFANVKKSVDILPEVR